MCNRKCFKVVFASFPPGHRHFDKRIYSVEWTSGNLSPIIFGWSSSLGSRESFSDSSHKQMSTSCSSPLISTRMHHIYIFKGEVNDKFIKSRHAFRAKNVRFEVEHLA